MLTKITNMSFTKNDIINELEAIKAEERRKFYGSVVYAVKVGKSSIYHIPKPERKKRKPKYREPKFTRKEPDKNKELPKQVYDISLNEVYKHYVENTARTMRVPYDIFMFTLRTYFGDVIETVIDKAIPVKIPYGFGTFSVKLVKNTRLIDIDYRHYRSTGNLIPLVHENLELNAFRPKVRWDKQGIEGQIFGKYRFKPCLHHKVRLNKQYKEGKQYERL